MAEPVYPQSPGDVAATVMRALREAGDLCPGCARNDSPEEEQTATATPTSPQRVRIDGGLLVHAIGERAPYLRTRCDVMVFYDELRGRVQDQILPPDTAITCRACARHEQEAQRD